jgi:hypothetical protein
MRTWRCWWLSNEEHPAPCGHDAAEHGAENAPRFGIMLQNAVLLVIAGLFLFPTLRSAPFDRAAAHGVAIVMGGEGGHG